jgi:NADPH:quinone reductase
MQFCDVAKPSISEDKCLVRVEAAGVNFLDTLMMRGLYQVKPQPPFTPGIEVVGVVVERGRESPYAIGDRLCSLIDHGGFAEFVRAPRLGSVRIPAGMPARDAVALPSVYPTALLALRDRAGVEEGETVLVHAGAGGVGSAAIQLAKHWGATAIATAGGPDKVVVCRNLGADVAIDYRAEGFVERVRGTTGGRGVDVVIDPIGGQVTIDSLRCLAWGGRLVVVGFAAGTIANIPVNRLLLKNAAALGVYCGAYRAHDGEGSERTFREIFDLYAQGVVRPVVRDVVPLEQADRAIAAIAARETVGKVAILMGGDDVIDPQRLLDQEFPEIRHTFTRRDTILYALGAGIGYDPIDPEQLRFVYERNLVALPTMATMLAYPGDWYRDFGTGLDHHNIVHASASTTIHAALPVEGTVLAKPNVLDVIDKGKDKGALVVSERVVCDAATGQNLATLRQTAMCRNDGGFSPAAQKSEPQRHPPNRAPDYSLTLPTTPQAALVYRLSGDPNPLHADPEFARAAGFPRPILHGLATMGLVCHATVRLPLGGAPERLARMDCRFTAPVYPGEAIESQFWRIEEKWLFRAQVSDRVVEVGAVTKSIDGA